MPGEGLAEIQALSEAGFSNDEINQFEEDTRRDLLNAGFSVKEADEYFGIVEPDMQPVKDLLRRNIETYRADMAAKSSTQTEGAVNPELGPQAPEVADNIFEAMEAGLEMSVAGLAITGKPDTVMPENAGMFMRIANQIPTLAADLPFMVAGGMIGGAVGSSVGGAAGGTIGSIVPGVGTAAGVAGGAAAGSVMGSGAGAFALPTALRGVLMDYYEKGGIKDFSEFWERATPIFLETVKSAGLGAVTMGTGAAVGKVAAPMIGTGGATAARLATEVGVMTSMGAAMEGHVPKATDFVDAAILVGGMHAAFGVAGKLRTHYAKTGELPAETALRAQHDPVLKQELLSVVSDKPLVNPEMAPRFEPATVTEKIASDVKAATVEAPKAEGRASTDAANKVLESVGEKGPKERTPISFNEFYKNWIDKYDPIKVATSALKGEKKLAESENPYTLARMVNDFKAKVRHIVEKGTLDFKTLEKTGKGLKEILDPHIKKAEMADFEAYIIAKRALEIEGRGLKSGVDIEAAKVVVKEGAIRFENSAKELVEFQNRNLKYLRDSGRISKETYDVLVEAGKSYIPFSRIVEGAEGGKGKANPLKKLKGSESKIQNPIQSILENAETTFRIAEQNRAIEALVRLAEQTPGQTIIEKVPGKSKAIEVSEAEVKKFFDEHGIEGTPEAFTIFRGQRHNLEANEFEVYRNGKREVYKADPLLAEAIKRLEGDVTSTNLLLKMANAITTVKKIGISLTPDFILRNIFRDQITAGTFTKSGTLPFVDIVRAVGDLVKKNDAYYNWLKSGGANGAFMELNTRYLETNVFKLDGQTKFINKALNVINPRTWYEVATVTGSLADQATRLAEFKRVTQGASKGPKVFEGGYASREITIDFQRIGAKMSAFNAITSFANVGIQGLDRTARAIKDDPSGVAMKGAMYITTPSILLWWANKDDPRYQEIPRWQKDLYWIIPTDDWQPAKSQDEINGLPPHLLRQNGDIVEINRGVIYRLPKPQELGILFGSVPERVLEAYFKDNPKAYKDFEDTMISLVTPNLVPDAAAPIAEQFFNKSFFTGAPIIPGHLEGVLPEYQYTDHTSDAAKGLSKIIGSLPAMKENAPAPVVVENYVRQWTGTLGMYSLQLADKALQATGVTPDPVKPLSTLADIPFVKAFVVRNPSASSQSIVDFNERQKKNAMYVKTVQHLSKQGDFENMEKEFKLASVKGQLDQLTGLSSAMADQHKMIRLIHKNPDFTPEFKRESIDKIYYMMIEEAKLGNQLLDQMEAAYKEMDKKQ